MYINIYIYIYTSKRSHSSGFIVACDATIQTETIERAMRHVDDEPTLTNPAIRKIVLGIDEAMESSSTEYREKREDKPL